MKYEPVALGYAFDELEPYIDERTMELHYTKHYQTYINNLNDVLAKYPALSDRNLEDLMRGIEKLEMEEKDKITFRNNGGGFLNHTLFWKIMGKNRQTDSELSEAVKQEFGSIDEMKNKLSEAALKQFGSGWGWLVRDSRKRLKIYALPNQDSPFLQGDTPLIGLDVWEHAYYLKYQNRRADYIKAWWNVVKII